MHYHSKKSPQSTLRLDH